MVGPFDVTATWSIEDNAIHKADEKRAPDASGTVAATINDDDNHYDSLVKALSSVQKQLNEVLTKWKDAMGNETGEVTGQGQTSHHDDDEDQEESEDEE